MADELGDHGDTTFRPGGALHKISTLASTWEERARKAEARLLVARARFIAIGAVVGMVLGYVIPHP